jgi:integrase
MQDAGRAKTTRSRALAVIRSTYAALVVAFSEVPGVLDANPAREVRNIKVDHEPKTPWLAEDEMRRLLIRPPSTAPWVERRDWVICATLAGTGWRRAEIARLRRDALLDTPGGFAAQVHAKGGKDAIVPLPVWLSHELAEWCQANRIDAGPIFPRREGADVAVGPTTVRNAVKRSAERAGLDLTRATPHAIRRSFATITGQRGVSIEDRQAAMLHASKATTERYDKASKLPAQAPGEVLRDLVEPSNGEANAAASNDTQPKTWPPRRADYE